MKILVIDNSKTFLRLMISILSMDGYNVIGVIGIRGALDSIKKSLPDLIVLDLYLINDQGFVFLQTIKKKLRYKRIPVLVVSSITKPDVIKKAIKMGASDYITKPFNIQDLKNKCSLLLKSN